MAMLDSTRVNIIHDAAVPLRNAAYDALQKAHEKTMCVREWVGLTVQPYIIEYHDRQVANIGVTIKALLPDNTELTYTHNSNASKEIFGGKDPKYVQDFVQFCVVDNMQKCIADLIPTLVMCADLYKKDWATLHHTITGVLQVPRFRGDYFNAKHGKVYMDDTWWNTKGPGKQT